MDSSDFWFSFLGGFVGAVFTYGFYYLFCFKPQPPVIIKQDEEDPVKEAMEANLDWLPDAVEDFVQKWYEINREAIDVGTYHIMGFEIDLVPDSLERKSYNFVLNKLFTKMIKKGTLSSNTAKQILEAEHIDQTEPDVIEAITRFVDKFYEANVESSWTDMGVEKGLVRLILIIIISLIEAAAIVKEKWEFNALVTSLPMSFDPPDVPMTIYQLITGPPKEKPSISEKLYNRVIQLVVTIMMQAEINIVGINLQFLVAEKGKMDEEIEKYENEGRVHTHRFVKGKPKDSNEKVEYAKKQNSKPKIDEGTLPWYVRKNLQTEKTNDPTSQSGIVLI